MDLRAYFLAAGDRVRIKGLRARPDLNGKEGQVRRPPFNEQAPWSCAHGRAAMCGSNADTALPSSAHADCVAPELGERALRGAARRGGGGCAAARNQAMQLRSPPAAWHARKQRAAAAQHKGEGRRPPQQQEEEGEEEGGEGGWAKGDDGDAGHYE